MAFDILMSSVTHSRSVLRAFALASSAGYRHYYDLCWLLAPASAVALSGARRDLPGYERTPSLHNRRIYATSPWSPELRGHWPARPARQRLLSSSCSSARSFAPRFLPTLGRPHAVALRFVRC